MINVPKLFSFQGKVTRSEWWIANLTVGLGLVVLMVCVQLATEHSYLSHTAFVRSFVSLWCLGFWLSLSLGAKRWRDLNRSGWRFLLVLLPFVNLYVLYCYAFRKGAPDHP